MRSYLSTNARLSLSIPFIRQRLNGPLRFPFNEGEMALVLRYIAGDAERGADGVAIADTRFRVFDVGPPLVVTRRTVMRCPFLARSAKACLSGPSRWVRVGSGPAVFPADLVSRIPRCTAATGSSHRRARTNCSPVVCFISIPVPTGRELRNGSFTNSTPAMASTRVSAPATASFESLRPFAIEKPVVGD